MSRKLSISSSDGLLAKGAVVAGTLSVGALLYYFLSPSDSKTSADKLNEFQAEFELTSKIQDKIALGFSEEMERRLQGEDGCLKMIGSYISKLPSGQETGVIYALDMGGSNYRVVRVELEGSEKPTKLSTLKKTVPEALMSEKADADQLFGWLADQIVEFATSQGDLKTHIPIGFTFSFGAKRSKVNEGILMEWTKGYATRNCTGRDVVELMEKACIARGLDVKIHACLNDTVGTLMSCAYQNHDCLIGLILGTGSNACYVEPRKDGEIVNIEWGGFDQVSYRTVVDVGIDEISPNRGRQLTEKMISGMYLGEISRRIFNIIFPNSLPTVWGFETKSVSDILVADETKIADIAKNDLKYAGVWTQEHSQIIRKICEMVRLRSATLATTLISVVIQKTQVLGSSDGTISVGIDGSLYKLMPGYKEIMRKVLEQRLGKENAERVQLRLSEDGSGKGAALVVAALMGHDHEIKLERHDTATSV